MIILAKTDKDIERTKRNIDKLNKVYQDLIDDVSSKTDASSSQREREIDGLIGEIDDIIAQEIESLSNYTGADISTFLVKLFNDKDARYNNARIKNINDIFNADEGAITNYFLEKQRDTNIAYNELDMLASQLYELKEAILTTRDSIITSDDVSQVISRILKFDSTVKDDEDDTSDYVKVVEAIEKKFKLPSRIKNFIVPNTLKYGKYAVYHTPYADLFAQYAQNINKFDKGVTENTVYSILNKQENRKEDEPSLVQEMASEIMSEIKTDINNLKSDDLLDNRTQEPSRYAMEKTIESYLKNIEVYEENVSIPLLEGEDLATYFEFKSKQKAFYNADKRLSLSKNGISADGVLSEKPESYGKGDRNVYFKLLDPKKLFPIKILDETICYCYMHEIPDSTMQPFSNAVKITDAAHLGRMAEDNFVATLSNKIVKAFDKDFLEKNQKFKTLILNALMYDESYRKHLRFQIIPVDYITEFKVNEDENGEGQSILKDSLFYAKLYLALLIFKMIQILTKSMDTRIYYVKNSGMDSDIINSVQRVARQIKEKQINYYDILNPNTSISKIGNAKEIFMPTGRGSEKGIEFDILAGQDVQLNTDFMDMLRQGYINATGVPSVIMNYINEADYAKTLVMANSKFIGRVISYQSDFNVSLTEMYQKLMRWTTDLDETVINGFEYVLNTPKTLNTNNLNDLVGSTDQLIQYMIKGYFGESGADDETTKQIQDLVTKDLTKYMLPMLPWSELSDMEKQAIAVITEINVKKKAAEKANEMDSAEEEGSEEY